MFPEDTSFEELFDKKYHRILYYLERSIQNAPDSPISILKIQIANQEELESSIKDFKVDAFISDVQFIVMNIVGSDGLVSMFNDFSIYSILPSVTLEESTTILETIVAEIKNMFNEIFGGNEIIFNNSISNYPKQSKNFIELFYLVNNE